MSNKKTEDLDDNQETANTAETSAEATEETTEATEETTAAAEEAQEEAPVEEDWQEKYVRLYSEFDNFRKRTSREKIDIIKTASADVIGLLLPILDDFERAMKSNETSEDIDAVKEGFQLIHNKFSSLMEQKGLKPMNSIGEPFNTDHHEAITEIPAPSEDMKGKVVDAVEKGYFLNDKVLRYAKVVVGK